MFSFPLPGWLRWAGTAAAVLGYALSCGIVLSSILETAPPAALLVTPPFPFGHLGLFIFFPLSLGTIYLFLSKQLWAQLSGIAVLLGALAALPYAVSGRFSLTEVHSLLYAEPPYLRLALGFALVRMRTGKLLKRLLATPMRKSEFLLSFMLARLAFLAIEVAVLLAFARFAFDVVVNGSVIALFLVAALGALTFSGLGLLVASRARTQEGVMGLMNVVSLPMWILSGVFFSADRFPHVIQPVIRALPLTAVVDALRGIMIDGSPLHALALPLAITVTWCVTSFAAALALFRWR